MIPNKKNLIYFVVWLTISVLLTYACSATPETVSMRLTAILASEDGCVAPCWQSIIPGESSEDNLLQVIDSFTSSEFSDLNVAQLRPVGVEFLWRNRELETFIRVRLHDDEIILLGFHPHHDDFSLSMITEALGQPDSYGASILGSEKYFVMITLIYEAKGVVFETRIPISIDQLQVIQATCEFESDWTVPSGNTSIYFLEPGIADEMVRTDPIGNFHNPTHSPQMWTNTMPLKLTMCP
jgi:hypothetical protein